MKKAFTIIELIFVIVIIGILIAVAIPKLNSTREDAKSVTIVTNLKHFLNDVASYYLANGEDSTANSKAWTAVTYDKVTDTIDKAISSTVLPSFSGPIRCALYRTPTIWSFSSLYTGKRECPDSRTS